ncbi:hypothetical protein PK35_15080 [Tamlana nanhaiensis]|uniref:Uncharacterized protein n=1 Tax=Neotamlana nanhaiensis TaxID=1382798 RepID=A0A0D7VYA8_9FLAO|nr:hypothetical protein [Tamlana nanhaiensis]KJD31428.1 hypothetical protein PK35_15080 [Tamlana nanhaiensis]
MNSNIELISLTNMIKKITFLIFITSMACVMAQDKNFEDGFIVTTNSDTLYGKIKKDKKSVMSKKIYFAKNGGDSGVEFFKPSSLKGFSLSDENYVSVDFNNTKNGKKIASKRFAQVLVNKEVSLYKVDLDASEINYEYESPAYYGYVLKMDSSFYSLTQEEVISNRTEKGISFKSGLPYHANKKYTTIRKYYIGILKYAFLNCSRISTQINNLKFADKSMIKLIYDYNKCMK